MAAREEDNEATPKARKRRKPPKNWRDLRIRVTPQLHAAIEREAVSESMTVAGFVRACVVRILRARSH
jgi:hypothetical protein